MINITKANQLARTWGQQSFAGWVAATTGATHGHNDTATGDATKISAIELDDFADLLESEESRQFENVSPDEWSMFLASSDRMLMSMQGCLPFIWG